MPIAIVILLLVIIAIAFRRFTHIVMPIWLIMLIGALAALLLQQITPYQALAAIEPDVILYLLGVFFIAQAAEESGYLTQLTDKLFLYAKTGKQALFIIIFILGSSAALLMNDTIAIIGTPIILQLCRSHKELAPPLLYALAFSITIGSVASPIGNPQNLLIAVKSGMDSPFLNFIKILAIPTLLSLVVTYGFIYSLYKHRLNKTIEKPTPDPIQDVQTILLVKVSLGVMCMLLVIKVITDFIQFPLRINFSYIALLSALPLLLSRQSLKFIKHLDWGTLLFFASTFILMQSVWDSGFFQAKMDHFHIAVDHIAVILIISLVLSQFISNVPLVALYLPLLMHHPLTETPLLALAVGSTIAGNISLLGAASNIIIIQNVEKRGGKGFGFFEFMRTGIPLTFLIILIYAYFLHLVT